MRDYTEWWVCNHCVAQWFVPEDIEQRSPCPFCGHESTSLVGSATEPNPLPYVREYLNEQQSLPVRWICNQPGIGKVDMALRVAQRWLS